LGLERNTDLKSLLLALALALPLPALAETREERVAVATEYVDLALQSFDMKAIINSLSQPILQQVAAAGQSLTDEQMAQIDKLYADTFTEPMTTLMRQQSELMADIMTLAEITALRDFYSTPEGRSAMAKLPQLTAAQQPGLATLIADRMSPLMPKVLAIINGEAPPETTPETTPETAPEPPPAPTAQP
jgi:hypothetical protein